MPPADSVAAVLLETERILQRGRELTPALAWPPTFLDGTAGCPAPASARDACAGLDLAPCVSGLVALYDVLRAAPCQPTVVRNVAADLLADDVGAMIVRMQDASRAVRRGRCDLRAAPDERPARVLVGPSPERLVVEPVVALRGGTRWALVVDGLTPAESDSARAHVVPRPGGPQLAVPDGAFTGPIVTRQRALGTLDVARTTALAERLERDAADLPAWPAFAGVSFTLPAPLGGAGLAALRARYVPADAVAAGEAIVTFDVLDVRAGLLAYRAALATLPCPDEAGMLVAGDPVLAGPFPHVGALLRLRVESLELRAGQGAPSTLGAPPDLGRRVARPLLAAVPRDVAADAPVVLLVGGLKQSASVMLAAHAESIATLGMMAVALELPHQGTREDGGEILTLLDPATTARNIRQAAIDALAVVGTARRCGFLLPEARRVRPAEVLYVGYSLGAMVGTMVRAVEPDLGPAVFFAPGGDHADWSGIRVAQALGSPLLSCIGGPEEGQACMDDRTCAPPGVCGADPAMHALSTAFRLPYTLASAGGEPVAFAVEPAPGARTVAPLLLLTGDEDYVITPNMAGRLADAYGLAPAGAGRRAAGTTLFVETPDVGHELSAVDTVRERAYTFLARRGVEPSGAP